MHQKQSCDPCGGRRAGDGGAHGDSLWSQGMRSVRPTILLLAALVLTSCSRIVVSVDHDSAADFRALQTYAWRPGPQGEMADPRFDSAVIDKYVRAAIDRVLASKGYRMAAPGATADFLVGYDAVTRQKVSAQTINRRYGYRAVPSGGWRGGPQTHVPDYDQGTLVIDIIDSGTVQLLWRGSGTGVVDPQASPEKREQRINDAVERILADFPPR